HAPRNTGIMLASCDSGPNAGAHATPLPRKQPFQRPCRSRSKGLFSQDSVTPPYRWLQTGRFLPLIGLQEHPMKLKLAFAVGTLAALSVTGAVAQDAERGKTLYATCGACHGPNGEGMEALNAPALAGQESWYTIRQLQNFKSGVRGSNPKDIYGMQMAPMAQTLPDDQAIADVAAYIQSLGK